MRPSLRCKKLIPGEQDPQVRSCHSCVEYPESKKCVIRSARAVAWRFDRLSAAAAAPNKELPRKLGAQILKEQCEAEACSPPITTERGNSTTASKTRKYSSSPSTESYR